jgi:imidazolonepropionase-like amidohydrolase
MDGSLMTERTVCLALALAFVVTAACRGAPRDRPDSTDENRVLALVGGTIYPAPDAAPIDDGTLVIEGERIAAVGARAAVRLPARAVVIDVRGRTVLPGFWNSHVHLTEPKWVGIDTMAAERATDLVRAMLTRFGFVHVFDVASFPDVTLALRERIQRGEVPGPDIRTTLLPFVPPNGTPRYVAPLKLPELGSAFSARDSVRRRIGQGAEGIKLFTVPITRTQPFPEMDSAIVRAVVDEAHRGGLVVFAHPTNPDGVRLALEGGVDILTHPASAGGGLPDSMLREMQRRNMALIPTLTLWEEDFGPDTTGMGDFVRAAQNQVRAYSARGGQILFGTDVGYIARYDPTREYELMAGSGMDFHAILETLTTAPAARFGRSGRTGRLAPGLDADIVVVAGDPLTDIRALGQVRLTMKRGRVLYDIDSASNRR